VSVGPEFWELTLSGALVSWPPVVIGFWVQHRKLTRKLEKVTHTQTGSIQGITDRQTRELLLARQRRARWRFWP
jgi:hypothetical protein